MRTLAQAISSFHPVAATIESIEDQFRAIAEAVFNSGYFLVNKGKEERRIYPIDIEFYLYAEYDTEDDWRRDVNTFENEKEQYRASFLIRAYKVDGRREDHPTYLWEDMFGECRCDGTGLNVVWKDERHPCPAAVDQGIRHNLNGRKGVQDTKRWRFWRVGK